MRATIRRHVGTRLGAIALIAAASPLSAQQPRAAVAPDSAIARVVRAFYLAAAQRDWGKASALFDSASVADFHRRSLRYLLSWAVGHDSLPATGPGGQPPRAPVTPVRMLTTIDSGVLARHADRPLPRFAPGTTIGVYARTPARDVLERIMSLKWTAYPVRAMPAFRAIAYEQDTIAQALVYWPADSAPDDPLRASLHRLRRRNGQWRLLAIAPLFYQSDVALYAIPRPELPPVRTGGIEPILSSGDGAVQRIGSVATTRTVSIDPALMSAEDSVAWARARQALARTDTITVRRSEIEILVGDTLSLGMIGATGRDAKGQPVREFVPAFRIDPSRVARLVGGGILAVTPGEAELSVTGILPPSSPNGRATNPARPRSVVKLSVKPRGSVPHPTGRNFGQFMTWGTTGDSPSLRGWAWFAPSWIVPGDTVYFRAITVNTGATTVELPVRDCGGLELRLPEGMKISGGAGWQPCTIRRDSLAPGDSLVGEAWGIVDTKAGSHRIALGTSPADAAVRRPLYIQARDSGGATPRSGRPSDPLMRRQSYPYGPPRTLPYVVRSTLAPGAISGITERDLETTMMLATAANGGLFPYRVSEEAFARSVGVPHLIATFSFPDSARYGVEAMLAKRERLPSGEYRVAESCRTARGGTRGGGPMPGTSFLVELALQVQERVRQFDSGTCVP